jgi:SAM-dependent methyltransferase
MGFWSIISFAHKLIEERLRPGDAVIDATVGNGVDTVFLAGLVGMGGAVYGFDIQEEALEKARTRMAGAGFGGSSAGAAGSTEAVAGAGFGGSSAEAVCGVKLLLRSHAQMEQAVPASLHGEIAAVMFNLGYLPGGDHTIVTTPFSTLAALEASLRLLKKGGVVTIVLYSGHEGGREEADAVAAWAGQLPQHSYQVLEYRFLNQRNTPPYLIAIEKR